MHYCACWTITMHYYHVLTMHSMRKDGTEGVEVAQIKESQMEEFSLTQMVRVTDGDWISLIYWGQNSCPYIHFGKAVHTQLSNTNTAWQIFQNVPWCSMTFYDIPWCSMVECSRRFQKVPARCGTEESQRSHDQSCDQSCDVSCDQVMWSVMWHISHVIRSCDQQSLKL